MKLTLFASALALAFCSAAFGQAGKLYSVHSTTDELYEVNPATGATTFIANITGAGFGQAAELTYDSQSDVVYLSDTTNDSLWTIDLSNGNATLVGAYTDSSVVMHGLEYNPDDGMLYGGSFDDLYRIDKTTGAETLIAAATVPGGFLNLGYDTMSDIMYGMTGANDSLYTVNLTTGVSTFVGAFGSTVSNPHGLAYAADVDTMYMSDSSSDTLYTINLTTGAATAIGSMGSGNWLSLVYIPIPEPGSLSLLAMAVLMVRRRR